MTTTTTKSSIARAIFETMKATGTPRKIIIDAFVTDAGMTTQGAATYYYNFTKMVKEGKLTVADQIGDTARVGTIAPADTVLDDLTDVEMVMFYNKYAANPNTDLATRDQVEEAIYEEVTFS